MLRSLRGPRKQYTYIKLDGTVWTHALRKRHSVQVQGSSSPYGICHTSCMSMVSSCSPRTTRTSTRWQYKWQNGSSSIGSKGRLGPSNGVIVEWLAGGNEGREVALFTVGQRTEKWYHRLACCQHDLMSNAENLSSEMENQLTKYTSRTEPSSRSMSTSMVLCSEVRQMALSSRVKVELDATSSLKQTQASR